jgi:hypothetical protein
MNAGSIPDYGQTFHSSVMSELATTRPEYSNLENTMPSDPTIPVHFNFGEAGDGRNLIRYASGDSERLMLTEVGPDLYRLEESSFAGDAVYGDIIRTDISWDRGAVTARNPKLDTFSRYPHDRAYPTASQHGHRCRWNVGAGVRWAVDDLCPGEHREGHIRRNWQPKRAFLSGSDQQPADPGVSPPIGKLPRKWSSVRVGDNTPRRTEQSPR